ncbi:MAG: hypothetical protein BME93_05215 [Methanosarcinales archaeon Met12]|nr:MAG: hypothetical protein BME93_05215 [Methanosarcinales archaeon Met12]
MVDLFEKAKDMVKWKAKPERVEINVKGIDRKTYLEFKAEATRRGMAVGKAVTEAMLSWLEKEQKRR